MKNSHILNLLVISFYLIVVMTSCCQQAQQSFKSGECLLPEDVCSAFDSVFWDINGISVNELHSLLVVKDGQIIYERYGNGHNSEELHSMWSATKTFTAIAVGFAQQEGLLKVDSPIVNYLTSDQMPLTISPQLAHLTTAHLLSLSSGWAPDTITERMRAGEQFDPVATCLSRRFLAEPGERWGYNNQDSYMAGIIVENVTGMRLQDYLREKLFTPLGIDTFLYDMDAMGHNMGATGLYLQASSLAKMGQLLLQKGEWDGTQLLDSAWISRMTSVQSMQKGGPTESDWRCGYGFQVWMCHLPGSYRADGMWGQYCLVLPDKNAVVVMTSLCTDREAQLNSVWHHIYPRL